MDTLVQQYSRPSHAQETPTSEDLDLSLQLTSQPSLKFALPPTASPSSWLRAMTDDHSNPSCPIKIAHGTTTLAFRFQGGIIVCTDSRATAGNWIASQTVKKVIEINSCLLGTMAGGAADCQYWLAYLGMQCRLHELRHKKRISVAAASKILANLVYSYKGMGLSMGTMCAGVTPEEGPALYYIDSDGTRLAGNMFCVGSGQTFAYGVLDAEYKYEMGDEEARELGKRSILAATHRDAFSGGYINLYHVKVCMSETLIRATGVLMNLNRNKDGRSSASWTRIRYSGRRSWRRGSSLTLLLSWTRRESRDRRKMVGACYRYASRREGCIFTTACEISLLEVHSVVYYKLPSETCSF